MADIAKVVIPRNGNVIIPAAVACGAGGATVVYDKPDEKITLIIGTAEATIKAGNGLQGAKDLVIPFTAGTRAVVIESGAFVNTSGVNKGKILITGATATVQAIVTP